MKTKKIFVITLLILVISFFNIPKVEGAESKVYLDSTDENKIEEYKKKNNTELVKEAAKISDKTDYNRICVYRASKNGFIGSGSGSSTNSFVGFGLYFKRIVLLYVPDLGSDLPMKTVYIDIHYPADDAISQAADDTTDHVTVAEFIDKISLKNYVISSGPGTYSSSKTYVQKTTNYHAKCPGFQYFFESSDEYWFTPDKPDFNWNPFGDTSENGGAITHVLMAFDGAYDAKTFKKLTKEDALDFKFPEEGEIKCSDLMRPKVRDQINRILTYVRILVPLIIVALGMMDFGKAVLGDKEEEMKKAQARFIKRLIIGVVIFLLPTIIDLILDIANSAWKNAQFRNSNCGL